MAGGVGDKGVDDGGAVGVFSVPLIIVYITIKYPVHIQGHPLMTGNGDNLPIVMHEDRMPVDVAGIIGLSLYSEPHIASTCHLDTFSFTLLALYTFMMVSGGAAEAISSKVR